ncbi:MAG: hypothetical protein P8127_07680 [Acidobacteriota bacterium]
MMNEATAELLSRHLDGDLSLDEERELSGKLDADPALARRLAEMRRIKGSIAALASEDLPPAELDNVIEPLLREKPSPLTTQPWTRWLAAAAVVVLGLTAIVALNQRSPSGPKVSSIGKVAENRQEPRERFQLAPLPTSALPIEERPLGSSDRLLASPVPEVELDNPPPLDVRGPLEKGAEMARTETRASALEHDAEAEDDSAEAGRAVPAGLAEKAASDLAERKRVQVGTDEGGVEAQKKRPPKDARAWESAPPRGRAQLFVFVGEDSAWREFTPAHVCKAGRYMVRIVVTTGVVREAKPIGGAASASPSQRLCAADLVIGLEIEDIVDGQYSAEIVIEPRAVSRN